MNLKITPELFSIFQKIIRENKNETQWAEIESSDMYQTENFSGGFDETENAFCFSYYDQKKNEYWFQLPLNEIKNIVDDQTHFIAIRKA